MLVKGRRRPTYLLSKNLQIRLWHRKLGHASNMRVIGVSRLTDGIYIDDQSREGQLSSNSEDEEDLESLSTTILLKVTDINGYNS